MKLQVFTLAAAIILIGIAVVAESTQGTATDIEPLSESFVAVTQEFVPEPMLPAPTPTPKPVQKAEPKAKEYTEDELEILALIIYQEAGGDYCSDSTRQMVGEVFLNRVADARFPDSFEEVATAKQQYGRLYWTGLVWPERASNPGEKHAVQRAYDCAKALLEGTVERILPPDAVWQSEFPQGIESIFEQDGLYFCR